MAMEEPTSSKRSRESDDENEKPNAKKISIVQNDQNDCDKDSLEQEENHFLHLFTDVLNSIIEMKRLPDHKLKESIILISRSKSPRSPIKFKDIDLSKFENICAYTYSLGRLGAGLARFRTLNAIQNCKVLEKILKKPDLEIISLGSGPASETFGFLSALAELQFPKSLNITFIDKFEEWKQCIDLALNFIKDEKRNYGQLSELFRKCKNVRHSFIKTEYPEADDLSDLERNKQMFPNANVIIISRLLWNLKMKKIHSEKKVKEWFTECLWKDMTDDAVILLIDTYFEDNWTKFDLVYQWGDNDVYHLTSPTQYRFDCYEKNYSKYAITVLMKKKQS